MKCAFALLTSLLIAASSFGQAATTSTTVPITLDHDRIIIDVRFPMPDGSKKRVRAWVDNGNPEMWITGDLAKTLSLPAIGEHAKGSKVQPVQPPKDIIIGGLTIHPDDVKEAKAAVGFDSVAPGSSAEITIPSIVLRHYDVQVDYLNRELTLAAPETMRFDGDSAKVMLNADNGLIQMASSIGSEKENLALDLGASWSLISSDLFAKLLKANPGWPHMTFFQKRAGVSTAGLIGANALLNYRVGIDYAHQMVYFKQTSKNRPPDMDVVGLVLRPEPNLHYTVIGIADFDGKPSVPDVKAGDALLSVDGTPPTGGTMGQAWSLLGGAPDDTRTLVLERAGKQFTVQAKVYRFLSADTAKPQ
jgi:hypothetical protein